MSGSWPHPAALADEALLAACDERRRKGSGPGGQHRNKVETGIVLVHRATGVVGQASEERSQPVNRRVALRRLRLALATSVRTADVRARPRSALWTSRCVSARLAVNPGHRDFPALLAEALDVLSAADWDARRASAELGCTPSQLVRFVKDHAPAMEVWNRARAAQGLRPLR